MGDQFHCTEGVVLRVSPYRDYDQILTLFTQQQGVLKLFYKGTKKTKQRGVCSPLTQVEVVYKETKSELCSCDSITMLQSFLSIRNSLDRLEAACDMLEALSFSQLVGKPALPLYQLLIFYLNRISIIENPWILANSFRLKILNYEGILTFYPASNEGYFEEQELLLLEILTFSQSFAQLSALRLPANFQAKIRTLFIEQLQK